MCPLMSFLLFGLKIHTDVNCLKDPNNYCNEPLQKYTYGSVRTTCRAVVKELHLIKFEVEMVSFRFTF